MLDRSRCHRCMRCVEVCPARALEVAGRAVLVSSIIDEVERDRIYYEESGGGLTITGGEPLAHVKFTQALLEEARRRGFHTCIETCGFAPPERIMALSGLVDLFLWDIKDTDPQRHQAMTDAPLAPIMDNLRRVDAAGGHTWLRCVLVDGVNLTEPHIEALAALYKSLSHCQGIILLPYHPLGNSKLERLGFTACDEDFRTPSPQALEAARARLTGLGAVCLGE